MEIVRRYPKYNPGNFLPRTGEDWFWSEGTLSDDRPFRAGLWYQSWFTYLAVYMSTKDIEHLSERELKDLLVSEGIMTFDDDLYLSSGFYGINLRAGKFLDHSGSEMWHIAITIGDEDGTYVRTHFKNNRYQYLDDLGERPTTEDYLLGITEASDTLYSCVFVNNTGNAIDMLLERPPVVRIQNGTGMDEIHEVLTPEQLTEQIRSSPDIESLRDAFSSTVAHGQVPPGNSLCLAARYYDWEFDFPNERYLFLRTDGKEILIGFFMEKYFTAHKKGPIPFTDHEGRLCQAKIILQRDVRGGDVITGNIKAVLQ